MDDYLGSEIDFSLGYTVSKDIKVTGGYSQMFGSATLERVKGVTNPASTDNWAWVMISINPRIFTLK
jgi:hypothetical protein